MARATKTCNSHPAILAYSIGNEIPTELIRWQGAKHVEQFLSELCDVAKQHDPEGLVTYASFPPTEYLDLSFLDFATFNVYLHDREAFHRYLARLQNIVGVKPLLLGELGMDTIREGEQLQADFLAGHAQEAVLMGLAGMFVFSWTDDWFTGGHQIEDWAFGITRNDRSPKPSYHALHEVFEGSAAEQLSTQPKVSVVVCTYNGGSTLEQCLHSLLELEYPDYEVIVVNDGSTDNTEDILSRFPEVHAIHQSNQGLSTARNVGLHASTGEIVAYTDSDCFADPDWLTHLVYQLQRTDAHAVGGPNPTPEDGWLAACVAASPGQPTHVLESDQVAEHIPGCNMAFRRDALLAIAGFDPIFRKAGDDVDVCWRLQHAGMWITFAPGAFVWHHRRQGPRAYFRQQMGYGEAEALLAFKHPEQFNRRGDGKWRGTMYGDSLKGLQIGQPIIYRGTFGTGLFQCLYQPGPAHWAMLPATLEWHTLAATVGALGFLWWGAWLIALAMLVASVSVAIIQAIQAKLEPKHRGLLSRVVIAGLCYSQPLVRSWKRYRTRFFAPRAPDCEREEVGVRAPRPLPLVGCAVSSFWAEDGCERTELLAGFLDYLNQRRCAKVIDAGWSEWDVTVFSHPWTCVEVLTTQENHGGDKRLLRVRYRVRPRTGWYGLAVLGAIATRLSTTISPGVALGVAGGMMLALTTLWWRGTILAGRAVSMVDTVADKLNLTRCSS